VSYSISGIKVFTFSRPHVWNVFFNNWVQWSQKCQYKIVTNVYFTQGPYNKRIHIQFHIAESFIVAEIIKKFPAFFWPWKFIIIFIRSRHWAHWLSHINFKPCAAHMSRRNCLGH
jgi:hypothetical protein